MVKHGQSARGHSVVAARAEQASKLATFWSEQPHGQHYLVDHTGTHPLTPHQAKIMAEAPDGIEIYWTRTRLDYEGSG